MVELNLKIHSKTLRARIKWIELGCINSKPTEEKTKQNQTYLMCQMCFIHTYLHTYITMCT